MAHAGSCERPAGGGTLHLCWPSERDRTRWPAQCDALAELLAPPPPPWDRATAAAAEAALRRLEDFSAVACDADAATLHCALQPRPMVVHTEVLGPLPIALVREDLRRRLFLRPGTVVADLAADLGRQQQRVRRYLEAEGFFDGDVVVRTRDVDGAAPLAGIDVEVAVDAGHPVHVGAVRLRGVVGEQAEALVAAFSHTAFLWFGQGRLVPRELDADAERAVAVLRDAGYPAALVRAGYHHRPGSAAVELDVRVERGPHLDLHFCGNAGLGDHKLAGATTFRSAGALDAVEVENSRLALLQLYAEAGFDSVAIDSQVARAGDQMSVTFHVAEGPRRQVTAVEVQTDGPPELGAELAKEAGLLTRAHGLLRHGLVDSWLRHDLGALTAAARARGYTRATAREEHAGRGADAVAVRFSLRLGPQSCVGAVRIEGLPDDLDAPALRATLRARPNAPQPTAEDLDHDQDAVHAALSARGYLHAEVGVAIEPAGATGPTGPAGPAGPAAPQPTDAPQAPQPTTAQQAPRPTAAQQAPQPTDAQQAPPPTVDVCLRVRPGAQLRRGGLLLRGAVRTQAPVIEHELALGRGELLDAPALGAARRRLRGLNLFSGVQLRPVTGCGPGGEPWLQVRVQEREVRSLDAVLGVSSDDGFSVGADFRDRNVLGYALAVAAELRLGNASHALGPWRIGNTDKASVRASLPKPFGAPLDADARLSYRLEDRQFYRLQEVGGGAGVSRTLLARGAVRHAPGLIGRLGYSLDQGAYREKGEAPPGTRLPNAARLPTAIIGRVFAGLSAEARDAPLDPRSGYAGELRLELAEPQLARPLFADGASFWRLLSAVQGMLTLVVLRPDAAPEAVGLGGPLVLAGSLSYSAAGPVGPHGSVPASETFAYGGDFSVRGMPPRGSSAAYLAHYMLTGSAELRWYAWTVGIGTLQIGGFFDAGSIARAPAQLGQQVTVTGGPVLRYVTAVGPLSLAYGWPLLRAADLRSLPEALPPHGRLHVTLGYNF